VALEDWNTSTRAFLLAAFEEQNKKFKIVFIVTVIGYNSNEIIVTTTKHGERRKGQKFFAAPYSFLFRIIV
jgi:hypothetical protein